MPASNIKPVTELPLNPLNPIPFLQPFLVLYFESGPIWYVDVAGELDRYLKDNGEIRRKFDAIRNQVGRLASHDKRLPMVLCEPMDWKSQATELLTQMFGGLAQFGHKVVAVTEYRGSGGPTHVLRNGAFFRRMDLTGAAPATSERFVPNSFWNIADYIPAINEVYSKVKTD